MAIVNSWSVKGFRNERGAMKIAGPFVNSETGETYKSLAFEHPTKKDDQGRNEVCFVSFSKKLGELNAEQLKARHQDLQIVENEEGRFSICEKGESSWVEVDI